MIKNTLILSFILLIFSCHSNQEVPKAESQNIESNTIDFPAEIQAKIDKVNELNKNYKEIPNAINSFSIQELELLKQKMDLLNTMISLTEEIMQSGYSDKIENFSVFDSGFKLQKQGVEMQIDALEEMKNNGTLSQ
jgi:hypothetical protein